MDQALESNRVRDSTPTRRRIVCLGAHGPRSRHKTLFLIGPLFPQRLHGTRQLKTREGIPRRGGTTIRQSVGPSKHLGPGKGF